MRYKSGKIVNFVIAAILMLPFTGAGAIKHDYFQPIFQFEHQTEDRYVINQKYFASKDIVASEFYKKNPIFESIDQIHSKNGLSYEDILKFLPTTIAPTTEERLVAQAIVDNALRVFLTSESARQLEVIRAVDRVEKAMNTNIKLGESDEGVEQKLSFNYDFVGNRVRMDFSGSFDGQFAYSGALDETTVTVSKKIINGTVGFSHYENIIESKDIVTLSYNF